MSWRFIILLLVVFQAHALAQNRPPSANAGPDQIINLPTNRVLLPGSGSDPDQNIIAYQWTQLWGPSIATIAVPTRPQTEISNLVQGVYQFQLRVTDAFRDTAADIVTITVNPPQRNRTPTANAGPDQNITLPTNSVTLVGVGSDPDENITSYQWTQITGPSTATIALPASPQTEVSNLVQGVYQFQLRVRDAFRDTAADIVIVNVNPAQFLNRPPSANAGPDQVITLPTNSITLNGSGTDPDEDIITYLWTQVSGPSTAAIAVPTSPQTQVSNLFEGVYQFQLSVMDNQEAMSNDIVMITVNPLLPATVNQPPEANVGPDQTITLPENSFTLMGNGSDPDGTIVSYRWTQRSGPSSVTFVSPDTTLTIVNNLQEGTYRFELTVTDNQQATATDELTITVNPATPADRNKIPWILITGILVIGTVTIYYFFVLPPSKKTEKVIVYHMHKDEEKLIDELLPGGEKTEGFTVGHVKKAKLKQMKKNGLALQVLNTSEFSINTPGNPRKVKLTPSKEPSGFTTEITLSTDTDGSFRNILLDASPFLFETKPILPAFFIMTLDAPLLPVYQERLKKVGVSVLQRIPQNSYVIFIREEDQLEKLKHGVEFKFIRMIDYYSAVDKGIIVREGLYQEALRATTGKKTLTLDLILHREQDIDEVMVFLKRNKVIIIRSVKNNIRITLPADSQFKFELAANKFIQMIYEYVPPVFYNNIARQLIGIDSVAPARENITETGDGEIIGVADTGIDRDHPDLKNHIIGVVAWGRKTTNDSSDPKGHGTHVAGSIVGDGTASRGEIKGMAPGAKIFFQSLMDDKEELSGSVTDHLNELFLEAYRNGARIHNNSWGSPTESLYTFDSLIVDQFIYEHPEMLIVVSAGNAGVYEKREKGFVGFRSIGSPATTKNGLTVGASRNKRTTGGLASTTYGKIWDQRFPDPPTCNETISGDPESLAAYSSRGPCEEKRIKPDIVAPGTDILSTKSGLAPLNKFDGGYSIMEYAFLGGTSMAAPIVSGAAAIVREYYRKKRGHPHPSAALVKATLINGTKKLSGRDAMRRSNTIPNPNQGYGMLDLLRTIPNEQVAFMLEFRDSLQDPSLELSAGGQEQAFKLATTQSTWIRVCLAYTDIPDRGIQHDLDLIVDHEQSREKWFGNMGNNVNDPYAGDEDQDRSNNLEIVRIDGAAPGLYTIKVFARNVYKGRQGFAIVITTGDLTSKFT